MPSTPTDGSPREGNLRSFVNVYLNDEETRFLQGADTPLEDGDELSLLR